ncbi:MAG: tRNA 2-thiouridine(34) synthase MnmA [Bacilli bacterium]
MKKVILGLSGGVDSAVACYLLQQAGYAVEGVFMRNWDSTLNNDVLGNPNDPNEVCPQEVDYLDALAVANKLGIPLHRIDFVEEYWERVFSIFLEEYRHNRTPNPDILCNKEIKFNSFLEQADMMGCDYIAMGHYARSVHQPSVALLRGLDGNKDQSYFLCQLTKAQVAKSLFPIGHLTKSEVRSIATAIDLPVATKKDSTGVCFIGERRFKAFLENYLPHQPGEMIDTMGRMIGKHDGLMYYTIGQRHGLSIGGPGDPWFVIGKIPSKNQLLVGQGFHHPLLYSDRCLVMGLNWLIDDPQSITTAQAKFRYRQPDVDVVLHHHEDGSVDVSYPTTVRAVTPGQAAVFYHGEVLLGGGTIECVYMNNELRPY